jgi:phage terminase small subunit
MLSDRQLNFVREYVKDFNGASAYRRAGYSTGGADSGASMLLSKPEVQQAVEAQKAIVAAAAGLTAATILQEWTSLAFADARKITHTRVSCCPCCYGIDHKRQWTRNEYQSALDKALSANKPIPEIEGGIGYDKKLKPNPECPECSGDGVARAWVCDMRDLDPVTARLIVSVKQTKDGVEVKLRDQDAPLQYLAKYMGMLIERRELAGPGGGPIPLQAVPVNEMTDEELLAIASGAGPLLLEGEK